MGINISIGNLINSYYQNLSKEAYGGYVKKGLVFQLDCAQGVIANADGTTTWKNLINGDYGYDYGTEIPKELTSSSSYGDTTNGVVFDGTKKFSQDGGFHGLTNVVIEACFQRDTLDGYAVICSCPEYIGTGLTFVNSNIVTSGNSSYQLRGVAIDMTTNLSTYAFGRYIGCWKNGEELELPTTTSIIGDITDDTQSVGYGLIGKIYSIRIYDKDYYNNEVAAKNYAEDQKRFNKALPVYLYGGDALKLYGGNNVNLYK